MNLNSPPFPLPLDHSEDQANATSSFSRHIFFDESPSRINQQQHQEDEGCVSYPGGSNEVMKMEEDGRRLSRIRKRDQDQGESLWENNSVKWISSKTRLMEDTSKYSDHESPKIAGSRTTELEDHMRQYSSSMETELSSNTSSYNNNNNNNIDNSTIRVCADCNTTKTPLWRSGPKGPKSLCNACGIRQRKARQAMAIAADATAGAPLRTPTTKIKVHQKEKRGKKGHTLEHKKLFKMAAGASNRQRKQLGFEDYLINLKKDLAFHRLFPQDEKEAALLLMALSSGLVHS
ncbi:GATA transcription factor 21-like [Olea europaea subsp. europaea]|uniref:GATA transcription factor 21-like n=1 Tax=Olea europaea subsp. europaea TaxID=158383 RepID=A0A8S0U083_OLEEU|nr:GATA transcription factor 21-like [Olea europaea subsp. europaea]